MLPSLLARDIQQGLKQFLVSGFEPADAFMHGLMSRFVEEESAWLKGPYVQVGLPFVTGSARRKFFQTFETEHPGYGHQEQAWKRLSSQHLAASTLVATGTGSKVQGHSKVHSKVQGQQGSARFRVRSCLLPSCADNAPLVRAPRLGSPLRCPGKVAKIHPLAYTHSAEVLIWLQSSAEFS